MKKFTFGLQRVLELRERREAEQARRLAVARDEAAARAQERDALAQAHEEAARGVHGQGARSAGELRAVELVLAHMGRRVDAATATAAFAANAVETAQLALNDAFRDRRVLDRLKERALEAWQLDAVRQDRQQMDAIALARFGQRTTPTNNDPVQ
jgi:flagellar FliJ protein